MPRITPLALVTALLVGVPVYWALPEGLGAWRSIAIVFGWVGCGLLLANLLFVIREPWLAKQLGGLERMYVWHHKLGLAAYIVILSHPLALAFDAWTEQPSLAWAVLAPWQQSWPGWLGWLSLLRQTADTIAPMKTPYVPHIFGEEVDRRLRSRRGWLTAGVASSISWPSFDMCVEYAGDEYFLRGSEREGKPSPPCITIACNGDTDVDAAIGKIYRFTSILSWFEGGYVDVSGYIWGSHPSLYGGRTVYSSMGIAGAKSFNCNHMPVIEDENVRKALAFWREGQRLDEVHDSYAFLSFYKVIESQFHDGRARAKWITSHIDQLTDRAAKRVAELRAAGVEVSEHLFESGRCAVAHASLEGEIVDPDVPADRKRLPVATGTPHCLGNQPHPPPIKDLKLSESP